MAGDWIKMRTTLEDDPTVLYIVSQISVTGVTTDQTLLSRMVVGCLHKLWSIADAQTRDGRLVAYTPEVLDRKIGLPGFTELAASAATPWIIIEDDALVIPKHDRHLSKNAKKRAEAAERQRESREQRKAASQESVTPVTKNCDQSREEKSREESKEEPNGSSCPTPLFSDDEPPVLVFPTSGKNARDWTLTQAKLDEYAESYPAVDVLAECRKALQWVRDNPTRRKTYRGMGAYLNRWLAKVQDNGHGATVRGSPMPAAPALDLDAILPDKD